MKDKTKSPSSSKHVASEDGDEIEGDNYGTFYTPKRRDLSTCTVRLPEESRDILLQTKKWTNPFDEKVKKACSDFYKHAAEVPREEIDLPEMGLLLQAASKVYAAQADFTVKRVLECRDICLRIRSAYDERRKAKKEAKQKEGEVSSENAEEQVAGQVNEEHGEHEPMLQEDGSSVALVDGEKVEDTIIVPGSEGTETITLNEDQPQEPSADGVTPEDAKGDLNDPETQSQGPEKQDEEPPKKKAKNGIIVPPTLMSCFEELELLNAAGFFDDRDDNHLPPPLLSKAFRLTKRKLYGEDYIPVKRIKDKEDKLRGHLNDDGAKFGSEMPLPEEPENGKPDISFSFSQDFPSITTANFSPEDQAVIQECINELHYLPFTFGLSKQDLKAAFKRTVGRMSEIFKKNDCPVTKSMINEASVIKTNDKVKENGRIHPVAHNLGDIYTTLVRGCREECETIINNASVSILERSNEKSFAESRTNIREMIQELQRNIVPKFSRVPLMAENTPEFFQHVTNFEKKMKKILEAEAKREEFDVRKYEREVLEVTTKESSELERCDDVFVIPCSPTKSQSIDLEATLEPASSSPSTRSSFDGSSVSGSNWVPLRHIFQHMKSFDRTETARSFYAVLALLSYQNLDINYDQLYSMESAALIEKQFKKIQKEEDVDTKYPRGVKIMTSRCPDADKEEVYVAALTSESRDETFRHLLAQEAKNIAMLGGAVPGTSRQQQINDDDDNLDEGIAEAMSHFVEESSTVFTGRLHAKKRPRKNKKKAEDT